MFREEWFWIIVASRVLECCSHQTIYAWTGRELLSCKWRKESRFLLWRGECKKRGDENVEQKGLKGIIWLLRRGMRQSYKKLEWWVLSRMNTGLSLPPSPVLPIPACLPWLCRVQTCIWKLLHQGSCFTSLLQPSLLICTSLWKKRTSGQSLPQQCKRQTHQNWREGSAAEEGLRAGL